MNDDKVERDGIIRAGFMGYGKKKKKRRRKEGEREGKRRRTRKRKSGAHCLGAQLGGNMSDVNERGGYYGARTYEVHTTSTTHTHHA